MDQYDQPERRSAENRCLSILVDLGVTYRRTLGERVAWAFFSATQIAPHVANRVMAHDRERRLTDWERQAIRMAELREHDPALQSAH
jgi:hypothetical protein